MSLAFDRRTARFWRPSASKFAFIGRIGCALDQWTAAIRYLARYPDRHRRRSPQLTGRSQAPSSEKSPISAREARAAAFCVGRSTTHTGHRNALHGPLCDLNFSCFLSVSGGDRRSPLPGKRCID